MKTIQNDKTKIFTICGSMTFSQEMLQLRDQLLQSGKSVLVPNSLETKPDRLDRSFGVSMQQKTWFIFDHFSKIESSDAILVANYSKQGIDGYIGSNTLMEIAVASFLQKKIYILHRVGSQACKDEVEALATGLLNGELSTLP